ncbi:hypothetical protein, partial [Fluviicola sp.]|uniref:hypothetical protein n=1 Tax=Fluviicola sp. TaxID=1917219 RepID=UPI0026363F1D
EWTGEESLSEEAGHVIQEMDYPGIQSSLQKVTNWFLDMFESGKELPSGNIFDQKIIKTDN